MPFFKSLFFFYFSFFFSELLSAQDVLLDRISAIINGKIFSHVEAGRVLSTLEARREISPFIYNTAAWKTSDAVEQFIRAFIIRDKIGQQGYVITDDAVESRIRMTEERLGMTREGLLTFLKSKGVSYEEYFEIIREAMEHNIFTSRLIAPLITVTDQDLKNEYYKRYKDKLTQAYVYTLVDFSMPAEKSISNKNAFSEALKLYQTSGKIDSRFKNFETTDLDNIKEEGLNPAISEALKTTPEGGFSTTVEINGIWHSFYVKAKKREESQEYLRLRDQISEELFLQKSKGFTENWFKRESQNYFIQRFTE
jgi:peptidyl-prolyl cis-trans isomerase SurA